MNNTLPLAEAEIATASGRAVVSVRTVSDRGTGI